MSDGDPEQAIVRRLRTLDLAALQPGLQERCWEQLRERAGLPPDPVAPPIPERPDRLPAGDGADPRELVRPSREVLRRRLGFSRIPVLPARRATGQA